MEDVSNISLIICWLGTNGFNAVYVATRWSKVPETQFKVCINFSLQKYIQSKARPSLHEYEANTQQNTLHEYEANTQQTTLREYEANTQSFHYSQIRG